ncbi:ATP phosphoribosyltransferase regulatory subunit [Rhodoligotrophos appendicifer]|uniref:ATP phosphoribosyltransferase regulatory subunit n=1 Tax=Rhodoligotrophos appendicifer TaxID=987056 RepID=UPI001184893A|nr:ATP phosphoribosyltransferase regulatory subunit [Rhodoligotrophos appendicifer]
MPGRSSADRGSLEAQNAAMLALIEAAGFDHVTPDILQPADLFLDRSGEDIRTRTYVFTDPSGRELCLRPDLTVPTCRYHLETAPSPATEARYCYCGPAFRHQPQGADAMHPNEFVQVGMEWLGDTDAGIAEAEIFALTVKALHAAGLTRYRVKLGDLALLAALLDAIDMPERWRQRLKHQFWRPRAFRDLLDTLSSRRKPVRSATEELLTRLHGAPEARALQLVEEVLEHEDIPLVGGRTIAEIARRLHERARDRDEDPLDADAVDLIETYLAIDGAPEDASLAMRAIAEKAGAQFGAVLDQFDRRFAEARAQGIEVETHRFSGVFGRSLEYYSGFVFQIEVESATGWLPLAGGGRYDGLMAAIGSPEPVPAVGCAIHTERLRLALEARS